MGLDFDMPDAPEGDRPQWSYSGFGRFRWRVGQAIGIPELYDMEGFKGDIPWSSLEPNPLHDLLNHSDCDGNLSPSQCADIAPLLRPIVESWDPTHPATWHDRKSGLRLVAWMEKCAADGSWLEFT